ncbi:hypothetical protein ACTFIY_007877 [Dictyostelium cf. discoideum]
MIQLISDPNPSIDDDYDDDNDNDNNDNDNNNNNNKNNNNKNNNNKGPSGPETGLVGYMKNRGHFKVEYDSEAELVLKDFQSDRDIKLNVLESYDQRLDKRIRRRNFIVEKGLLDYRKVERKQYKEILSSLKCLLQPVTKEEHESMINGLINEKRKYSLNSGLSSYNTNHNPFGLHHY